MLINLTTVIEAFRNLKPTPYIDHQEPDPRTSAAAPCYDPAIRKAKPAGHNTEDAEQCQEK